MAGSPTGWAWRLCRSARGPGSTRAHTGARFAVHSRRYWARHINRHRLRHLGGRHNGGCGLDGTSSTPLQYTIRRCVRRAALGTKPLETIGIRTLGCWGQPPLWPQCARRCHSHGCTPSKVGQRVWAKRISRPLHTCSVPRLQPGLDMDRPHPFLPEALGLNQLR